MSKQSVEPCMLRSEAETILETPEKKVQKVPKKTKVKSAKAKIEKKADTAVVTPSINKAAKLREMMTTNPAIKFKEALKTFENLGLTLQAAQFYGVRKTMGFTGTTKVASAKRSTKTRTTAKAKATTAATSSVDSVLKARNILQTAFNDASALLGCADDVRTIFKDIK